MITHAREEGEPGDEATTMVHASLIQTINTSTTHTTTFQETGEKKHFIKGDIGIREKAHKQDTSQTQQPHSTIVTSAPTSPFQLQRKSHSTPTSQIQNMHASLQPLHSYPEQKSNHSYSNKITIQIFNNMMILYVAVVLYYCGVCKYLASW